MNYWTTPSPLHVAFTGTIWQNRREMRVEMLGGREEGRGGEKRRGLTFLPREEEVSCPK